MTGGGSRFAANVTIFITIVGVGVLNCANFATNVTIGIAAVVKYVLDFTNKRTARLVTGGVTIVIECVLNSALEVTLGSVAVSVTFAIEYVRNFSNVSAVLVIASGVAIVRPFVYFVRDPFPLCNQGHILANGHGIKVPHSAVFCHPTKEFELILAVVLNSCGSFGSGDGVTMCYLNRSNRATAYSIKGYSLGTKEGYKTDVSSGECEHNHNGNEAHSFYGNLSFRKLYVLIFLNFGHFLFLLRYKNKVNTTIIAPFHPKVKGFCKKQPYNIMFYKGKGLKVLVVSYGKMANVLFYCRLL